MSGAVVDPHRLGFRVEYDGTAFHGWQIQAGHRTVQGTLEALLKTRLDPGATIDGASRTDSGVHARDQLAATTLCHPIGPQGFVKTMNARLPPDVALACAWDAPLEFQPRFASKGKTYTYRLYRSHVVRPLVDRFAWRLGQALDLDAMALAARALIGTHDFVAYAATDAGQKTTERTIFDIRVAREPQGLITLTVEGNAFLKQMVRNIAGTLVEVGRGHWSVDRVTEILKARDRRLAGPTAPGRGLTLERVWFETPRPSEADLEAQAQVDVLAR